MIQKQWWKANARVWGYRLLLTSAFFAPFSLPAGRTFVALSFACLLYCRIRHHEPIVCRRICWFWLAYVLIAILASIHGIDPRRSLGDVHKLLWFVGIPVTATLVQNRERAVNLIWAYIGGSMIRSAEIFFIRIPAAWQDPDETFLTAIIHRGAMNHGQILVIAIIAATGLLVGMEHGAKVRRRMALLLGQISVMTVALLANFKRGSWAVICMTLVLFGVLTRRARILLVLAVVVLISSFHPFVWTRLAQLRNEAHLQHGGRLVMWTKIGPELLRQYPGGVGFRGVTSDVMQATARSLGVRVEDNRNHLHSNLVEIPVSLGWVGLAIYLLWMNTAVWCGLFAAFTASDFRGKVLAITFSLMLVSLFLNGIIEYNMGDAYIILAYGMIMGVLENAKTIFTQGASCLPIKLDNLSSMNRKSGL